MLWKYFLQFTLPFTGFPSGTVVKNPLANAGNARDVGLILGLGRSPGVGNGNPLQYSNLENSMDREIWQVIVHGITESDMTKHAHTTTNTWFHFNK